ncbi:MAG: hypothetical protein HY862_17035 [Chloroflexi bacterium]|nr:hypothetical protein [Chloroflexota bacterium]
MTSITARYPQRIAWATLLTAFVTFCLLMASIAWAINWVLFDSTIDLRTTVKVSRGTIGYTAPNDTERVVRDRYPVQTGDGLRADELSQGQLTIADPLNDDQVLATVQILGGSSLVLSQASRPRFGLGDQPYSVVITDAIGKVDIVISPRLERELRLEIRDEKGNYHVRLDNGGYYLLDFSPDRLHVNVRYGQAVVVDRNNNAKLLETNQTGIFQKGQAPQIETVLVDLLANPMFLDASSIDEKVPDIWGCDLPPALNEWNEPPGIKERVFFQDRYALHLARIGSNRNHEAQIGCKEYLLLDVSQYDSLYIRATVYLESHSVSGCGAQGTECPVILKMGYSTNVSGTEWIQGFYIHFDQGTGARIRCDFCSRDHEHVNKQVWYTFESSDFIQDLPIDRRDLERPIKINYVEIYASGHQYEAYVSEFALIGVNYPD